MARSKFGQIEKVKQYGGKSGYLGRRKNGENVGTFRSAHSAADALCAPKSTETFVSGHRENDVKWKWEVS